MKNATSTEAMYGDSGVLYAVLYFTVYTVFVCFVLFVCILPASYSQMYKTNGGMCLSQ